MAASFLLVSNRSESTWPVTVSEALASLGAVQVVSEGEADKQILLAPYDLIIIDDTTVEQASRLISRLRAQKPDVRILVVTLSPTWRRAREALHAGAMDYIRRSLNNEELIFVARDMLGRPLPGKADSQTLEDVSRMSKETILLADNDPDFLATRKEFLEQEGFTVISASNPAEARWKLEVGGVDLAILDIRLENDDDERDLSGLILAKKVARSVPKIILTNFPTFEYVREALRPQLDGLPVAVDFLAKVEGLTALLTTVEDVLVTVAAQKAGTQPRRKVFVAHGHDSVTRDSVADFLRGIGIAPIILFEEADRGDTIIEKLERCCREADFAIVLLTPDDFGYPKEHPTELKPRARQNVIFELGYMVARLGRRRVRVLYKEVEIPTNFLGVLYIEMDTAEQWRSYLIRELKDAGVPVTVKAVI